MPRRQCSSVQEGGASIGSSISGGRVRGMRRRESTSRRCSRAPSPWSKARVQRFINRIAAISCPWRARRPPLPVHPGRIANARATSGRSAAKEKSNGSLDKAVAEDGWKIAALLRHSRGDVRRNHSWSGALHYLGVLGDAVDGGGRAKWVLSGVGLAAAVAAVTPVARKARAKLCDAGLDDPAS